MITTKKVMGIAIIALLFAVFAFSIGGVPGMNGTNGSSGLNGTNGTSIGGGLNYYLHPTNSTILNSKIMDTTLNLSGPTRYINYTSLPTGTTLIQNWSSPSINVTLIPAGAYNLHLDALKIGGSGNHVVKLFYEIGLTNSTGGNYSIIGTSEPSSEILVTTPYTEADMLLFSQTKNTNTTDRLFLKLYAIETGIGLLPELQIQYGGMTDAYLSIPSEAFTSQDIIDIVQPSLNLKLNKSGDIISGTYYSYPKAGVFNLFDMFGIPVILRSSNATYSSELNLANGTASLLVSNGTNNYLILNESNILINSDLDMNGHNITNCGTCLPNTTHVQNTTAKVINTVYRNNGTSLLYISYTFSATSATCFFYTDGTNPPTTLVVDESTPSGYHASFMAIVIPQNYYTIICSGANYATVAWVEWY